MHREQQLKEFAVYLGKLTHAANSFVRADGVIVRDSDPKRPRKTAGMKVKKAAAKRGKVNVVVPSSSVSSEPPASSWRMPNACVSPVSRASSVLPFCEKSAAKNILKGIEARQEADFQHWWRESRSTMLQPKVGGTSAGDRLEALKQRVMARGCASGSSPA